MAVRGLEFEAKPRQTNMWKRGVRGTIGAD